MSIPTPSATLPNGSDGTTSTVPWTTDNAQWLMITTVAGCIINPEAIAAMLDSASQLVTVIIVLILVWSQLRGTRYTPAWRPSSAPLVSDINV